MGQLQYHERGIFKKNRLPEKYASVEGVTLGFSSQVIPIIHPKPQIFIVAFLMAGYC